MSTKLKIFVTGATGYLGGCVLARLLKHPEASSFQITALVRSVEKGDKLKTLGVDVVVGSYTDRDLSFLTDAAAQYDVVFTIADADNLPAAQAILKGMKTKSEKTGKPPILIHTSGTAIIADDARGLTSEHITYSDLDVDKLNALPETVLHRNVDIPIIEADKAGYVKAYIITPGTIFGPPSGPFADLGIQNTETILHKYIIKPSVPRKQGVYIGKGLNCWSGVFLEETADLYIILFDTIRKAPEIAGHGPEGYYFAESFVYSSMEVSRAISEALVEFGIGSSKEPSALTPEEINSIYGPAWRLFGSNSYAKADRSRALGWKPTSTHAELIANIRDEVKDFLAKSR